MFVFTVEDSDFVAQEHGSGSEEALESVITCRILHVTVTPIVDMMSLQRIVRRINLLLKRKNTSPNHPPRVPREAKQYVAPVQ